MGAGSSELRVGRFEDLEAWQKAIELAVITYKITDTFPKSEIYALTNQMRRASSSISANIAEGFSRHGIKDKLHFYSIAAGSLTELKSFVYLAEKLGYLSTDDQQQTLTEIEPTHKLLNGLIRSTKERL